MERKLSDTFARLDSWLASPARWWLAIAALVALQLTLIWTHQAWPDEYQALLIATDASSQGELLAWLRYEGHPPLWYWLLQFFSAFIPFDWVLPAAASLCAFAVLGAILFASPFTRVERLLLASSQYILFEFLTISRGTSLGVALVFAAMVAWRTRWVWVIMALLPLVDFLFGVISGVFLILKWRERDLWWPGIVLWLAASAFAGWTVLPAPDMVSASEAMAMESGVLSWFLKMGSLPFPFQGGMTPQWNTPVVPIAGIAWIVMLWLCWHLTRGFVWHRLLISGFFSFTLAFSLVIYPIGLRHLMLGCLLLFALVWLQRLGESAAGQRWPWHAWLILLTISGIATGAISTINGFDNGAKVVAEIERRGLAGKRWVAVPEWRVPAISGRSDITFGRLGEDCTFRFVRWDHAYSAIASRDALEAALKADIAANGRGYLLSDMQFDGFDPALITPLTSVERGYNGIAYYLYIIGSEAPEIPRKLPSCHSGYRESRRSHSLGKK